MIQHRHWETVTSAQLLGARRELLSPARLAALGAAWWLHVTQPHTGRGTGETSVMQGWGQSSRDKADTQPSPEHGGTPSPSCQGLWCPPWMGALISRGEEGAGRVEEAALAVLQLHRTPVQTWAISLGGTKSRAVP